MSFFRQILRAAGTISDAMQLCWPLFLVGGFWLGATGSGPAMFGILGAGTFVLILAYLDTKASIREIRSQSEETP